MDVSTLSRDLQSQLRSDLVVRNISNCVIELVENALDAEASSIAVRIDFETFRVEIVDNGIGLSKDDLTLIGERYFTSKRKAISDIQASKHFGCRGESLASVRSVSSKLIIISRALDGETYCKVFEGSSSSVNQSQVERITFGTTVIIENFLQKLPVRQRCTKPCEEFQTMKWFLQATALMFPKVNFSLRNDAQKSVIFHINRTNSTASTFIEQFPGAIQGSSSFIKLKTTHEDLNVKLMLSKMNCDTDQLQFVFVNKRYLPQCDVHKYLNKLLDTIDPTNKKLSHKTIYIFNLTCPREDCEISFEADRRIIHFNNWAKVKQILINLVKLIVGDEKSHHFEDSLRKKPAKQAVPAKNLFNEINTANTVFGLPASRPKMKTAEDVYDFDNKSDYNDAPRKGKEKKNLNSTADKRSRLLGLSKASRKVTKIAKPSRSPRLADQGVALTFKKSPIASRRVADEKRISKDKNKNRNTERPDDYAWMWKQPGKDVDSDSTEFSGAHEIADKPLVVSSKNKKNKKDLVDTKKNRNEGFKSIVTLSSRRVLRLPARERISKKQNHHFEPTENHENVIMKYGKVNKNPQYVCETNDQIKIGDGAQWTARISDSNSSPAPPPVTRFRKQSSPELDFEDNNSHQKDEAPLEYNRVTSIEAVDSYSKVNEWIAKLPPREVTILNDSATDYITPVNNPQVTDQIASDFKVKTKLSRSPADDLLSLDRSPEKRKSTQESFEPKCKLKLNFDKDQAGEYETNMKTCPKPHNKLTSLEWDSNFDEKSRQDCDFSNNFERTEKVQSLEPTQIMNEFEKENYEIYQNNNMSWNDLNNSYNFHKEDDDDLSKHENTQPVSTQSSQCPSQCRCKCHKKNPPKKELPHNATKEPISTQDLTQKSILPQDDEDDIIFIQSNDFETAKDSQNILTEETNVQHNDVVSSQQIENSADDTKGSEYFHKKIDSIDKLRFKMTSKFLASSSAVDIPSGMLEMVPKKESKIEKLDEDEKKVIGELINPYKMQDHITVDDFGNSCLRIFPMLKNPQKKSDNQDAEMLNCWVTFTKEDIPSFQLLSQIENKFLLARAVVQSTQTPMLILLDQHAVDERIRVERLLKDYTANGEWLSTPINPPIHLNIPPNYASLFTDYQSNLEEFGLHFEFKNRTKNKETILVLSFTQVPTCFYNRAMRESNNFQVVLKQLIESLTKEMLKKFIRPQGTLVHAVPNELQNVVNSEACRGAVKFGDKLTSQVCSALLNAIAQCKLPFQCAHGRPSVIPLVSFDKLKHLQKKIWKPSLKELKKKLIKSK